MQLNEIPSEHHLGLFFSLLDNIHNKREWGYSCRTIPPLPPPTLQMLLLSLVGDVDVINHKEIIKS